MKGPQVADTKNQTKKNMSEKTIEQNRIHEIFNAAINAGLMTTMEAVSLGACALHVYRSIKCNESSEFQSQYGSLCVETVINLIK